MVKLGVIVGVMLIVGWFRVKWWRDVTPSYVSGQMVRVMARVNSLSGTGMETVEGIRVKLPAGTGIGYGDKYLAVGKLMEGGAQNGRRFLFLDEADFTILDQGGWLAQWRKKMVNDVVRWLGGDEGALAAGVLLGGTGEMSWEMRGAFRRVGLSHVVAASGYNVSVVAGWVMAQPFSPGR